MRAPAASIQDKVAHHRLAAHIKAARQLFLPIVKIKAVIVVLLAVISSKGSLNANYELPSADLKGSH